MKTAHWHIIKQQLWIILLIIAALLFSGCAPSHVLHQRTEGSRQFLYIDFQRNHKPFELKETFKEGQTAFISVLGFEGDKILVDFDAPGEAVFLDITGSGFEIKACGKRIQTVLIRERETIITIRVNAVTKEAFALTLTRL